MSLRTFEIHHPKIGQNVYIDEISTIIGQVTIGDNSSVWPNVVIRGDVNQITIGSDTNIQDGSVLHCTHDGPYTPGGFGLTLGCQITVGHMVMLHGATIEDNCLIGMNSIVLDGCYIEKNTFLAAGSLVPQGKRLEAGHLWMGQPVRKIRPLTEKDIEQIIYSAQHYIRLAKRHALGVS